MVIVAGHPASAAVLIAAMSILPIFSIASKARFAAPRSESVVRSSSSLGVICQEWPQRSLHQPQALSLPPLPMIAFQ